MPINRLGPKPSVSSTDRTAGSTTTNTNFQGRNVSVADARQSGNFLPTGGTQLSSHTFSASNKYISIRNITPTSEAHDYEEMSPSGENYVNVVPSPSDNYEEMRPSVENYVNVTPPSSDDYEEMRPLGENDVNAASSEHDYEEINFPAKKSYKAARSVVDSPKTNQIKLKRSELIRMKQLGAECGDYMKELAGDLQKVTDCRKNLAATSKNDILALKDYVIPQHIRCVGDYSKALQTLSILKQQPPGQRKYFREANAQLNTMRAKLLETQGFLQDAIKNKNFSTEAASNYVGLRTEQESPANQLMKVQSEILEIHRGVEEIKYRTHYLGGDDKFIMGNRGEEVLAEIDACRHDLVALKAGLPQCLSEIKQAMDTINDYEARIREQPPAAGEQRTLRERRYTMHLANRLEDHIKGITKTIAESGAKLKKLAEA